MPTYERELNLVQGYNFKKDVQKPIGFITRLTISNATFVADLTVTAPFVLPINPAPKAAEAKAGTLKVISVLKKIKWDLGDTDPIEFEGTLSVAGKQTVMGLLYATMLNCQVTISWVIYEYDPLQRAYFVAFSNTVAGTTDVTSLNGASGLVRKDGDNLALTVQPSPSTGVQSPENYDFTLQVLPWPVAQLLYLSSASTRRVTKSWGRGPFPGTAP